MKQISIITTASKLALVSAIGLLAACSGSSDSGVSTTSINGYIVAAPVSGAQVNVIDASGNIVAGPVTTNASGRYALSIPDGSLAQDLIVKSTGGTFTDEATGNETTAGEMFAYVSANSLSDGATVCATPGSTIIADLVMNHGKTMTQAQQAFANAFGYTPDITVHPDDATGPAADASDESKLAGFRAAVFSQLATDLGLLENDQFAMFAALSQDLSDGVLDGVDASGAIDIGATGVTLAADIQNRFEIAMLDFHNSGEVGDVHGNDQTGLNNAQIGNLPFGKVAVTASYQIEYVPMDMMAIMEGKSTFQIKVSDRISGDGVPGLMPMLVPMMHMSDHMHSTPLTGCVSGVADGDYVCTVYYLMASQMMDGTSMGYWDLKFTVAGEVAHFYPAVMMAMGDTAKVKLQGQTAGTDQVMTMTGEINRKYFIFKDDLTGMDENRSFTVFIAALETMKSYPSVDVDTVLSAGTAYELTANPVTVEFSTDGLNWNPANNDGNGLWSSTIDITGLVDNTAGTIHLRLTINNEVKTTDGNAPGATTDVINEYSSFTITPGAM